MTGSARPRAGIVVTGTEVLTGRVTDRNGPWLAERLRELGVEIAQIVIVGDRPEEVRQALEWLAGAGVALILTSGGLGPTEDDLTAAVVAEFHHREMVLDTGLEARITAWLDKVRHRFPGVDEDAWKASIRKQAVVPVGATVLEPIGTAPGLIVGPPEGEPGPTVVVLPGPPGELQAMWKDAITQPALLAAVGAPQELRQQTLRLFGIPESEIAETLRRAREAGIDLDALEVTTCLRRGEVEVVTRYDPAQQAEYERFADVVRERHADTLFSPDGSTVDEQIMLMAAGDAGRPKRTIATAESCTAGLLAARLTEPAGSSAHFLGGLVVYSNEAKTALAGVDAELIERVGAVSVEVARALAVGATRAVDADLGVGITGIAGPGGGTEEKPVGTVCFSAYDRTTGAQLTRRVWVPGNRRDVRDRSTTIAMHLLRRVMLGESDAGEPAAGG